MAWAKPSKVAAGSIAFMVWWILSVFPALPLLPIGRTAGSLLGGTLMVVFGVLSPDQAFAAVDLPILGLLFGTMVVSVMLQQAGLFLYLGRMLSWKTRGGIDLMCRLSLLSALSSALFTNDTTCVFLTGFVLKLCKEKKLHPKPFLLALACSANIGSSATPIGNPQNLVIAVGSGIGFGKFLAGVFPAMAVGLVVNTLLLVVVYGRRLSLDPSRAAETVTRSREDGEDVHGIAPDMTDHRGWGQMSRADLSGPRVSVNESHQIEQRREGNGEIMDESSERDVGGRLDHDNGVNRSVPERDVEERLDCENGVNRSVPERDVEERLDCENGVNRSVPERDVEGQLHQHETVKPDGPPRRSFRTASYSASGVLPFRDPSTLRNSLRLRNSYKEKMRKSWMKHKEKLWKISVYLVTLGMLAALLAGLSLPWTAITAAVAMLILNFSDAGPSLDKVSYNLLVFFSGMFIATSGFNATGAPQEFWSAVEPHSRIDTASGVSVLSLVVTVLSNVVSNVPTGTVCLCL
ncbi:hypothetical protein KC19_1G322600 [Ceratodon purpureus]|uniref:Citrate transporter-like domain-containing protein n=1 Tax=Ceratodon purpureus TaxID=3225 RepID=A0A8T0JD99_CERPU|nr:hypothetical protein KC19_1G322600 [Ceratodon purpureus]